MYFDNWLTEENLFEAQTLLAKISGIIGYFLNSIIDDFWTQ